jgi:outer membrane biosynthesis protein TonB
VSPTNPRVAQNPDLDNLTGRAGTGSRPAPEGNPSAQDNRTAEQRLQAAITQRRAALTRIGRDATGTTSDEANIAFGEWFYNQLERDEGDFKQVEIPAVFPQEACPLEIETAAIYGVVIDPENEVVDEPKLIRSSGYQLFNQKALEAIATHEFENESDDDQVYLVTVKFDHTAESCQAPAPSSAPSGDSPPAG